MANGSAASLALISMVLGIVSLPLLCLGNVFGLGFLAFPIAIGGFICGFAARSQLARLEEDDARARTRALVGLILSGVTLALMLLFLLALFAVVIVAAVMTLLQNP